MENNFLFFKKKSLKEKFFLKVELCFLQEACGVSDVLL